MLKRFSTHLFFLSCSNTMVADEPLFLRRAVYSFSTLTVFTSKK